MKGYEEKEKRGEREAAAKMLMSTQTARIREQERLHMLLLFLLPPLLLASPRVLPLSARLSLASDVRGPSHSPLTLHFLNLVLARHLISCISCLCVCVACRHRSSLSRSRPLSSILVLSKERERERETLLGNDGRSREWASVMLESHGERRKLRRWRAGQRRTCMQRGTHFVSLSLCPFTLFPLPPHERASLLSERHSTLRPCCGHCCRIDSMCGESELGSEREREQGT